MKARRMRNVAAGSAGRTGRAPEADAIVSINFDGNLVYILGHSLSEHIKRQLLKKRRPS